MANNQIAISYLRKNKQLFIMNYKLMLEVFGPVDLSAFQTDSETVPLPPGIIYFTDLNRPMAIKAIDVDLEHRNWE